MELRKLAFLEDIVMNLERTECTFKIKKDNGFSVFAIRDAVQHAGFSLRFLSLTFTGPLPDNKSCFQSDRVVYQFTLPAGSIRPGRQYQVLEAGFLPARDWKKLNVQANSECRGGQTVYLRPVNAG